jgi:hypothetical protein
MKLAFILAVFLLSMSQVRGTSPRYLPLLVADTPGMVTLNADTAAVPHRHRFNPFKNDRPVEPIQEGGYAVTVLSLAAGVLSAILAVASVPGAALIVGLAGVVLGALALNRRRRAQGIAIAGVILAAAGIVLAIIKGGSPF